VVDVDVAVAELDFEEEVVVALGARAMDPSVTVFL
jgi:hypothetical protein